MRLRPPRQVDADRFGRGRQPYLDLATREAVGNAAEVNLDFDVVIDTDPARSPFGKGKFSFGKPLSCGRSSSLTNVRAQLLDSQGELDQMAA